MTDGLFSLLEPVVASQGLDLFDVELRGSILAVTVDRPEGGVDLDALAGVNRAVGGVLDEHDPIPGHYTLEVSSPGVERRLRTPSHFAKALGEVVAVKTRPEVPGERRFTGELLSADEDAFVVRTGGEEPEERRLAYVEVDRVRTVFEWGPSPRPGRPGVAGSGPARRKSTKKRKQVTTS